MFKVNKSKARKLFSQGETILIVPKDKDIESIYTLKVNNRDFKSDFDEVVKDYILNTGEEIDYYYVENKYKQLCVWEGVILGNNSSKDFERIFEEHGFRVKFEALVTTQPDLNNKGNPVPGTGGRSDILFYIHDDDIAKFSIKRLAFGIRWWEDVVGYGKQSYLYPKKILDKYPVRW